MYATNQHNKLSVYCRQTGGGSKHNEERYELHLCEKCFFYTLATLEIERLVEHVLDENFDSATLDGFELK